MALSQHDLLRLLESLRSADRLELVRGVAERMLQELIEAEATARIGAEWNEHTETRTALRNGHRDKTLSTQADDLDLAIPKLRSGSFFPALLKRRRRIDQALYAVIMEAYVHGVSTRPVDDLVRPSARTPGCPRARSRESARTWRPADRPPDTPSDLQRRISERHTIEERARCRRDDSARSSTAQSRPLHNVPLGGLAQRRQTACTTWHTICKQQHRSSKHRLPPPRTCGHDKGNTQLRGLWKLR